MLKIIKVDHLPPAPRGEPRKGHLAVTPLREAMGTISYPSAAQASRRNGGAKLRDRAFGRSHMVHKEGNRQSLSVRRPPSLPIPSGGSSRPVGAGE